MTDGTLVSFRARFPLSDRLREFDKALVTFFMVLPRVEFDCVQVCLQDLQWQRENSSVR